MRLNDDIINELIDNKEYENLKLFLENYFSDPKKENKMYAQILKILKNMYYIQGLEHYGRPKVEYIYSRYYCIKRFYESLRYKDYEEALILVDLCIKHLEKMHENCSEMKLYKKLLIEVVKIQENKYKEQNSKRILIQNIKELKKINNENKEFNIQIIEKIKNIVDEILNLEGIDDPNFTYYQYMYEIISIIELINEYNYIDKNYFQNIKRELDEKIDFDTLLKYGDYIRSFEYINKIGNREKEIERINYLNIKVIFKLLKFLNQLINKNSKDNFRSDFLYKQIPGYFIESNYGQCISKYLNSNLQKDEEVLANMLILTKLNNKQ